MPALNTGHTYVTLGRLERDGPHRRSRPAADPGRHVRFLRETRVVGKGQVEHLIHNKVGAIGERNTFEPKEPFSPPG